MNTNLTAAVEELRGPASSPAQRPTPTPGEHGPRINDEAFDQDTWDNWYREQIRLSIEDPRPNVPHEEVEREFWAACRTYRSTYGCSNGS